MLGKGWRGDVEAETRDWETIWVGEVQINEKKG